MTLVDRINALVLAIQAKFNQIAPRLMPSGGGTGQALVKASAVDFSLGWTDIFTPANLTFGGGLRRSGASLSTTSAVAFAVTGKPTSAQVLTSFYFPFAATVDSTTCGGNAKAAATATYSIYLKRAGSTVVTWTWAAAATSPTVVITTTALAAGPYTLEAQTTADATLDSPSPTLGYFR
jgi:hypothetical protein